MPDPLSSDLLRKMHAYWRAPNYRSVWRPTHPAKHAMACGRWVETASRKFGGVLTSERSGMAVNLTMRRCLL